jgi:pimeloyl-ACP methyl ester carboxylesterase
MELEILHRPPAAPVDGPPLLFVHGAYSGAWIWDAFFLPHFAGLGYHAHAVSLRGHGKSDGRDQLHFWGISDYVRDVRAAVRRMDRTPVLVGHSLGGLLCQRFLADGGDAAGLVLLNSVPPHGMAGSLGRLISEGPTLAGKLSTLHLFPRSWWDNVFSVDELTELFLSPFTEPDHVSWLLPMMQPESSRVAAELAVFCRVSPDRISCPVSVIGAENDQIIPPSEVRETAAEYGVEPVVLPRLGHTVMVEDHWRDAADAVRRWLETEAPIQ